MIDSFILTLGAIATVFGWSFFSFWSAIPAGIALDLTPIIVAITVTVSYGSGAALVVIVGAPLRERIRRRMERRMEANRNEDDTPNRTMQMIHNAWDRFGLIGLGLLAPMTVGSQVGAVIGLSFGAKPWRLVLALTLGAAAWAIVLTLAVVLGVVAVSDAVA